MLDGYLRWTTTGPDGMTSSVAAIAFPDVPALPPPLRGRYVVHVRVAYSADDLGAGESLVAPLRALGPFIDTVRELPYTESRSIHNDPTAPGTFESGTALLGELDPTFVHTLLDLAGPPAPVPHVVELRHLGGQLARRPAVGNAVGHRGARYVINVVSRLERADLADVRPAHERIFAAIAPWSTGGRTLNFLNGERDAAHVRTAYEPADWERLAEVKAAYDPDNLFRLNHNIPPAGSR